MRCLAIMIALMMITSALIAQESSDKAQSKFRSGGLIRVRLSGGGYTISGVDSDTITVTLDRLNRAKVAIKAADSGADVVISDTPNGHFHADIEVPRRSDLWVRLSAGELKIQDVEGNKDVECGAGDLEIEIARPEEYAHRDASVTAGDLNATAFQVSQGGLFRSFRQDGKGKYRLHAHVATGNLVLRPPN